MTTVTEEQRMQMKDTARIVLNNSDENSGRLVLANLANDVITLCDALEASEAKCREQEKEIDLRDGRVAALFAVQKALEAKLAAAAKERIKALEAVAEQVSVNAVTALDDVSETWIPTATIAKLRTALATKEQP